MKTISERVKSAREKLEMSQADLAKASGVSPGTIGNLEAGTRQQPRGLLAIAAALKVHAMWLQTGKGPRELAEQSQSQSQRLAYSAPARPPPDFADRREVSDSDWATLNAVKLILSERDLDDIKRRAKEVEAKAEELVRRRLSHTPDDEPPHPEQSTW